MIFKYFNNGQCITYTLGYLEKQGSILIGYWDEFPKMVNEISVLFDTRYMLLKYLSCVCVHFVFFCEAISSILIPKCQKFSQNNSSFCDILSLSQCTYLCISFFELIHFPLCPSDIYMGWILQQNFTDIAAVTTIENFDMCQSEKLGYIFIYQILCSTGILLYNSIKLYRQ